MTLSPDCWIKATRHIADADGLKANIKGSLIGSFGIAVVAMICSVILGPIGLLLGGIGASIYAYIKLKGSYRPLSSVLKSLTEEQRKEFFSELADIRAQITVQDYIELILFLQGGGGLVLKKQLLKTTADFLKKTINADVIPK